MDPRARARELTRVVSAGRTDVGRQRKHNEDTVLVHPECALYAVADGMGGHNAGDVASKLVARSLSNYFEATAYGAPIGELPEEYAALSPAARRLAAGVSKANRDVFTISNTHQQHHGMGSTVVAIHLADDMVHIAHVGDSRCYRIRDGEIRQMTRDHSLINDALDMKPDLTKEELARLPKNIITRALGMKEVVKVDVSSEPTLPGDVFLLCSDGLTGMVPVDQILDVVHLTHEPDDACEILISEANERGGTDNISALIVRIEDAAAEAAADYDEIEAEAVLDVPDESDRTPAAEVEGSDDSDRRTDTGDPWGDRQDDATPTLQVEDATAHAEPDDDELEEAEVTELTAAEAEAHAVATPEPAEEKRPPLASESRDLTGAPTMGPGSKGAPNPGPAKPGAEAPRENGDPDAPELEVAAPTLTVEDLMSREDAEALGLFSDVDLEVQGPWPATVNMTLCVRCRGEIFPGNRFCVECGAQIEARTA